MKGIFDLRAGSIIGRDHLFLKKNNQDAWKIIQTENITAAVICDGCSNSSHSEFGANLGASLLAMELTSGNFKPSLLGERVFWRRLKEDVLAQLRVIALRMGKDLVSVINEYFLFTTVGAVLTPELSVFFSIGDGLVIVNGSRSILGPYPKNQPPYLSYNLIETSLKSIAPDLLDFSLQEVIKTSDLDTFLIGSDGCIDLIGVETKHIPGKQVGVGSINQFWEDDQLFQNPQGAQRRLHLFNQDKQWLDPSTNQIVREPGLLPDDTTLIVGRKT